MTFTKLFFPDYTFLLYKLIALQKQRYFFLQIIFLYFSTHKTFEKNIAQVL